MHRKELADMYLNVNYGGGLLIAAANISRYTISFNPHIIIIDTPFYQCGQWVVELGMKIGCTKSWDLNCSAMMPDDYFLFSN